MLGSVFKYNSLSPPPPFEQLFSNNCKKTLAYGIFTYILHAIAKGLLKIFETLAVDFVLMSKIILIKYGKLISKYLKLFY